MGILSTMEPQENDATGAGIDVVLVHPEIPHNSGCAGRLTAAMGARLHLVEPLGFSLEDRYLKRAGLDYWPLVDLTVHGSVAACFDALRAGSERPLEERLHLFSARGGTSLREVAFSTGDILVFGSESKGLPADLLAAHAERRVRIPIHEGVRSINLANAVAIAVYLAAGAAAPAGRSAGH